jgi:hypothetical protein
VSESRANRDELGQSPSRGGHCPASPSSSMRLMACNVTRKCRDTFSREARTLRRQSCAWTRARKISRRVASGSAAGSIGFLAKGLCRPAAIVSRGRRPTPGAAASGRTPHVQSARLDLASARNGRRRGAARAARFVRSLGSRPGPRRCPREALPRSDSSWTDIGGSPSGCGLMMRTTVSSCSRSSRPRRRARRVRTGTCAMRGSDGARRGGGCGPRAKPARSLPCPPRTSALHGAGETIKAVNSLFITSETPAESHMPPNRLPPLAPASTSRRPCPAASGSCGS